ncbi:phage tail fiber domain-containing protein [Pseudoduganella lutea]|uniref:Bacteriophage T7 tail fibre protein-like N-terminal domain-containing protein n=1 Tax=Pseudoduganella lutea TaxID=321985 RepID=A0A4V0Z4G2_9BURK|nr:phage tail fiber protein [Pseudoduganella lutea]QBE66833.1 hypothetical protein EWM63_30890 [Pseudoduganella lutea]
MPYSYVLLRGDGTTANFSLPFQYLDKSHITVKVKDAEVPFTWLHSGAIRIDPAPSGKVEIRRTTPKDVAPVNFSDGSVLKESDLDLMTTFVLFCAQEAQDSADLALLQSSLGSTLYKIYQGTKAEPPFVRIDGTELQVGDLYFNTTLSALQVYGVLGWQDAGTTLNGIITKPAGGTPIIAYEGQTKIPVPEGYTPGQGLVFLNGAALTEPDVSITDGANIIFKDPLKALDEVFYEFFSTVQIVEGDVVVGGPGGATTAQNVAFVPSGSLQSTNVQLALMELMNEAPKPSNAIPAPNGLFGSAGTSPEYARADHVHVGGTGGSGEGGAPGYSNGTVYAYQRKAVAPVGSPGDVTVDLTSNTITSPATLASGWLRDIPSGSDPLWVTVASASSNTGTDNISGLEWSEPVMLVKNGTDGLKVATVYIYQRKPTPAAPALPTGTSTYDFATKTLTGVNNGWSTTIPSSAGGKYLYVSTATASSLTDTDAIPTTEWAAAQLMAQDGAAGSDGDDGADGKRGTVNIATSTTGSVWSNSVANSALSSAGYGAPQNRDVVTLYNTSANYSETRFYSNGSWLALNAYINGNMLVTGTLSADKIDGGTITGSGINIANGNFSVRRTDGWAFIRELSGINATFDNTSNGAVRPLTVSTGNFGNHCGIYVTAKNKSATGHGIQSRATSSNGVVSSGIVGAANGYDFYADGDGVNYGPFTGAHDVLMAKDKIAEPGDILIDLQCVARSNISNTIFEVERSSEPYQRAAMGALVMFRGELSEAVPAAFLGERGLNEKGEITVARLASYDSVKHDYWLGSANALGEGQINVCGENGNIEAGDFIVTSSIPGKGMRQGDDLLRSYTVARARETVTFDSPTEVKQVACIYVCG